MWSGTKKFKTFQKLKVSRLVIHVMTYLWEMTQFDFSWPQASVTRLFKKVLSLSTKSDRKLLEKKLQRKLDITFSLDLMHFPSFLSARASKACHKHARFSDIAIATVVPCGQRYTGLPLGIRLIYDVIVGDPGESPQHVRAVKTLSSEMTVFNNLPWWSKHSTEPGRSVFPGNTTYDNQLLQNAAMRPTSQFQEFLLCCWWCYHNPRSIHKVKVTCHDILWICHSSSFVTLPERWCDCTFRRF